MNKFTISHLDLYYGSFQALKSIELKIPSNRITAFIGPSGCGKSTLLKTLNRMNDLVEGCRITGKVLLDGKDIYGGMDINQLRKRVGMVFQKPNPFPMSVYDNIAYGRPEATEEEIIAAAREAHAHSFIMRLPDGYDTVCTPELFSQGQWQLLSIARAAAANPKILLLDEITANLDAETENTVLQALKRVSEDRTVISISHRVTANIGRIIPIEALN